MAALFESFLYPLVIIFSVPLAAAGGFLGLFLVSHLVTYQPLDVLTMLGFIILVGVVVNNAILIVHQALNLMDPSRVGAPAHVSEAPARVLSVRDAVSESVRIRVRPIFMSMLTTVFWTVSVDTGYWARLRTLSWHWQCGAWGDDSFNRVHIACRTITV